MKVQKFAAGAVFVGAVTAGMFGAAPAFAGPGINYDNGSGGTQNVKFGDTDPVTGATALASKGNQALAVSTGLNLSPIPGSRAVASGTGTSAVAIDGITVVGGQNNHGFSALGSTIVGGKNNNVVTVAGSSLVGVMDPASHDNTVINFGGNVHTQGQTAAAPGALSLSVCGTAVGAQADHIKVAAVPNGLC